MAKYLLVLDGTDGSPALVGAASELAERDPDAEFVLLAPATPLGLVDSLVVPWCDGRRYARYRVQRAQARLLDKGLRIVATRLGNFDTSRALEDSLRYTSYAAVVVEERPTSDLPRLLHVDTGSRLARRFRNVRLLYVVADRLPAWPSRSTVSATNQRSVDPHARN